MAKKTEANPDSTAEAEKIKEAVVAGQTIITMGRSKIEAAMSIYSALQGLPQETIVSAFIDGASLTPKGAVTYWYNCRRKHNRLKASSK